LYGEGSWTRRELVKTPGEYGTVVLEKDGEDNFVRSLEY
jgi:hypothetical protein